MSDSQRKKKKKKEEEESFLSELFGELVGSLIEYVIFWPFKLAGRAIEKLLGGFWN
ncbi:hypothetical protein ACN6MY_21995 [Peribacillus sp. B-H-3]|uniref:hypothetical protein n=1 Tax=Peribacillus sp. B-H-3 TaxID=3400420 RepID=UPI003B02E369